MKAIRVNEIWQKAGVYYVRTEAMTIGFGCALDGEFRDDTNESLYVLVTDDNGLPLSTCRVHPLYDEGYAKIERVATVSYARGIGAGKLGIEEAEAWIKDLGFSKIVISSREEALGFYQKLGYKLDTTKEKFGGGKFVCVWIYKDLKED